MNPLTKIRSGANTAATKVRDGGTGAWRASRDGTTRTAGWVKNGVSGTARKARWRVTNLFGRSPDAPSAPGSDSPDPDAPGATPASTEVDGDGGRSIWERTGVPGVLQSARSNSRVAIAWAVLGFLVLAWIGWAIYVTAENGATAGLGVVISWPAVFAALALVTAPFVGAVLLVRHFRPSIGVPSLAGGGDLGASTAESQEDDADQSSDDSDAEDAGEDAEEESEDDDEKDEDEDENKDEDGGGEDAGGEGETADDENPDKKQAGD